MKLSLCSIGDREAPIETVIVRASRLGYEGVELHVPHIERFLGEGSDMGALKAMLDVHRLKASVISAYAAFLGSDGTYARTISHFEGHILPWAEALQGSRVRIFLDWIGSGKAARPEWLRIVQGLREVARLAASRGVDLLLETHQDQLTDTTDSTLRLIEETGMENVKINLDMYNLFQVGENPLYALERLFAHTSNVHLKNGTVQNGQAVYGKRLNEGDMDFAPFLKELQNRGYDEYMGVEWFGDGFWEAAEHELAWVKRTIGMGGKVRE